MGMIGAPPTGQQGKMGGIFNNAPKDVPSGMGNDNYGTMLNSMKGPMVAPPPGTMVVPGSMNDILAKLLGVRGMGSTYGVNAMKNIGADLTGSSVGTAQINNSAW